MKNWTKILITGVVLVCLSSCAPMSKESYLKKYNNFISEISDNYKSYSDKMWEKQTKKYEKFTGKWYEKFKGDFTLLEKAKIKVNETKFHYYKTLSRSSATIKEWFDALNVNEIKEKAQYYINNNMEDDLKQLYDEARKAGSTAEKTITEILNDLQVNIEKLKDN